MIVSPADFPLEQVLDAHKLERLPRGNARQKHPKRYRDIVTAFDIETSTLPEIKQQIMYIWQWQFGLEYTVVGRTWDELRDLINRLVDYLPKEHHLVVLCHNLSYEFQFLRTIYTFGPKEVFAVKSRKVLKCTMYHKLEFRCSYLHSNMSLDAYTHKMRVAHPKLSPADALAKYGRSFDYSTIRYPWTELDDMELEYITNDVLGLVEAYMAEMQQDGDTLLTIPLTSTGYVRRDTKRVMRKASREYIFSMQPDLRVYAALREAFRGGNTHANRYFANRIIDGPVYSADRSSSYPDVICNCNFPMTPFQEVEDLSQQHLARLIGSGTVALLLRISITGLSPKDPYLGCPYISRSKCQVLEGGTFDNGRVLAADYLETTITDIDLDIMLEQYQMEDLTVRAAWQSKYGKLPMPLRLLTMQYYRAKTELKGLEDEESVNLYNKSKARINAVYGMMVQDPIKQSILFLEGAADGDEWKDDDKDPQQLLEQFAKRTPLCYQWGVWVCAWARLRLEEGIRLAGDGFIYCDTDSVKYTGTVDWTAYNEQRMAASLRSGSWADDRHGTRHYMGVFEAEQSYHRFATMGAKKYAYQYEPGGPTQVTIAGVNKREGGRELDQRATFCLPATVEEARCMQPLTGLDLFKEGFVFHAAGGTESVYNDHPPMHWYTTSDGRSVEVGPNTIIKDSTYQLGLTRDYIRILADPQLWRDYKHRYTPLD